MCRHFPDQPVVGTLAYRADGALRSLTVEDEHQLVAVALRPGPRALEELLVGEVRPLRALDVPAVDEDFRHLCGNGSGVYGGAERRDVVPERAGASLRGFDRRGADHDAVHELGGRAGLLGRRDAEAGVER